MKFTISPARTSSTSSGTSIRPSASRNEEISPEPSRGNFATCNCPSSVLISRSPELTPTEFLPLAESCRQRKANGLRPSATGKPGQHRPHIHQETHEHRDRVAGETEHD